jgi:hypothetical protein
MFHYLHRLYYQFCGICAMMLTRSNMGRHCRDAHSTKCKPLKDGHKPKKSKYPNWEEFVQDPTKYNGESYSGCIYDQLNSDVEKESDEELLSRTRISKRRLKASEKEVKKEKASVIRHIELEYAEPTKGTKKLLDMCGNPRIKFAKGKLSKRKLREVKKYSKLHCVQWQLFVNAMKKKALRCLLKVQKARKSEADTSKQLRKARKFEVACKNAEARSHKLIKELYKKIAENKELYEEIDVLKGSRKKRICCGSQTDEWTPKERMLKHDLENEQHSNQLLRDELLSANEKL